MLVFKLREVLALFCGKANTVVRFLSHKIPLMQV